MSRLGSAMGPVAKQIFRIKSSVLHPGHQLHYQQHPKFTLSVLETHRCPILHLTNKATQELRMCYRKGEENPKNEALGNEVTTQFSFLTSGK
jgi:hypothetical protein